VLTGRINFTGSVTVGRIVAGLCGKVGKPILLELGGKAPAIVMPSADLEVAVNNVSGSRSRCG
jgi:benzaldehyde dehydrogenase (NAD)